MAVLRSQADLAEVLKVSKMTVSRKIKEGKIRAGVVFDPDTKKFLGISDIDLAAADYRRTLDLSTAPQRAASLLPGTPPPAGPSGDDGEGGELYAANLKKAFWEAELRELKYKEAAKELIPVRDVEARLVGYLASCRTKLLALPSRARQAMPDLSDANVGKLEALVREALEALAEGT